jgi:hypothetical protein
MVEVEELLPASIVRRATLRGKEYAWPLTDIPHVIDAAEAAGLASVGGQLQFRIPSRATCECYWVDVDTYRGLSRDLLWSEEVRVTAESARRQFSSLLAETDFVAEGRKGFAAPLSEFEAAGGQVEDAMCFVWYLRAER